VNILKEKESDNIFFDWIRALEEGTKMIQLLGGAKERGIEL
jgi:hypothetical protein